MIIGYSLGYGLNGKWFLPKDDPKFFCPKCGSKKVWDYVNRDFKLTQRADITETVDGFSIVSKHFRDVVTKFQMVREAATDSSPGEAQRSLWFDSRIGIIDRIGSASMFI
jgi:hypothetical protein